MIQNPLAYKWSIYPRSLSDNYNNIICCQKWLTALILWPWIEKPIISTFSISNANDIEMESTSQCYIITIMRKTMKQMIFLVLQHFFNNSIICNCIVILWLNQIVRLIDMRVWGGEDTARSRYKEEVVEDKIEKVEGRSEWTTDGKNENIMNYLQ